MNPQEPVKFASSESDNPQAGSKAQENADNNAIEPGNLQSEEEYRASEHASKPKDEEVNQEAEDAICDHDVLRGDGV